MFFVFCLLGLVSTNLLLIAFADAEASGAFAMNKALGTMYRSGFWMCRAKAQQVGNWIYTFLAHYAICANITLQQHKRRFSMTPKHHMISHDAHGLLDQASKVDFCLNPLSRTNQIQEDFIGRPSRLSRRVSSRSLHSSVMLRCLIMYEEALKKADVDIRGMDVYPDC